MVTLAFPNPFQELGSCVSIANAATGAIMVKPESGSAHLPQRFHPSVATSLKIF